MTSEERLAKLERMREIVQKLIRIGDCASLTMEERHSAGGGSLAKKYLRLNAELEAATPKPRFRVGQYILVKQYPQHAYQIIHIVVEREKINYSLGNCGCYDESELTPLTPEQI